MKKELFIIFFTILLAGNFYSINKKHERNNKMKLNAGIITDKLNESREFYVNKLGFEIAFESDWFLLLTAPGEKKISIAFLLPNHSTQQPIFQSQFNGKGIYFTIEVEDVDMKYKEIKKIGLPIEVEIRDEEWGDRHFAVVDPNGIGVDFVTNKLYSDN